MDWAVEGWRRKARERRVTRSILNDGRQKTQQRSRKTNLEQYTIYANPACEATSTKEIGTNVGDWRESYGTKDDFPDKSFLDVSDTGEPVCCNG